MSETNTMVIMDKSQMQPLADGIKEVSGTTSAITLNDMEAAIATVNTEVDTQSQLLSIIAQALENKVGVSPIVEITKTGAITTINITDLNGTHTATVNDGVNASIINASANLVDNGGTPSASVTLGGSEAARSFAFTFNNINGKNGERGMSFLRITTAPSSYTTTTGGFTPKYRIALSTVLSQAQVEEVFVGDTIGYSYYHYPVGYVDSSYVYLGTRVSIRGTAGTTPKKGTDYFTDAEKAAMVNDTKAAMPTFTLVGTDDNGVSHTYVLYGYAQS